MRFRFRLRTLLVAVVLLSPLLAFAARSWHSEFQNYHAALARRYEKEASELRREAGNLRDGGGRVDVKKLEEFQEHSEELFRKAHWHEFLSGRPLPRIST